jgi:ssDNA-binding Zn-finger/Zn-ribbon topoisomerase 1
MTRKAPQDGTETAKACPRCGAAHRLIIRTNTRDSSQFLGCPNYPTCRYTEPLPEDIRMELLGQRRLF